MDKYIRALVNESFYAMNPTEQLNKTLKTAKKAAKAKEEAEAARSEFISDVLGKQTVKKFGDEEHFAPIPVGAIEITRKDFDNLAQTLDVIKTDELIERLGIKYYRNDFSFRSNGKEDVLKTDLVLKTPDEMVDFFYAILYCFKKTYKTEEQISWRSVVKKFRHYLNK